MSKLLRRLAKGSIRLANWLIDGAVMAAVVLIVCFTAFNVIDNNRVMEKADGDVFEAYKPTAEGASFEELQTINPDVLGWLTLYGTGVDYPVVQGEDNDKYVNTDAAGEFALSGALFLDYRNAADFSDPSSIIYGHHMEDSLMFGDLDQYCDADYAAKHSTGNLYYAGKDHGVEVLGYFTTDAYDKMTYSTKVGKDPTVDEFVSYLRDKSTVWLKDPSDGDRLLVLSTCGKGTNNRHIVIARICDETFVDPYPEEQVDRTLAGTAEGLKIAAKIGIGLIVFLIFAWLIGGTRNKKRENDNSDEESSSPSQWE